MNLYCIFIKNMYLYKIERVKIIQQERKHDAKINQKLYVGYLYRNGIFWLFI
jgi:hypothetical protein